MLFFAQRSRPTTSLLLLQITFGCGRPGPDTIEGLKAKAVDPYLAALGPPLRPVCHGPHGPSRTHPPDRHDCHSCQFFRVRC